MSNKVLWLVIPCYNEQEILNDTANKLEKLMQEIISKNKISEESRIAFIDDGSKDATWDIIQSLCEKNNIFAGIKMSRNRGHQNALLGGLLTAKKYADVTISLDADLQDDIDVIEKMIDEYMSGNEIVYGVRKSRDKDTFFKRFTAQSYYKVLEKMGIEIVYNHADFRLMSKRAIEELEKFGETNLFLRGIVPMIGLKSTIVEYERKERLAGESKYPLKKMLALATEGITSFSIKPLKISLFLGGISIFVCLVMIVYSIIQKICGNTVSGWTSLIASIWGIGGLQLFMLGIVGEYIGKIYMETKNRPKFIVEGLMLNGEYEN